MDHKVSIERKNDLTYAQCSCYWGTDFMSIPDLHRTIIGHYMKVGYVVEAA